MNRTLVCKGRASVTNPAGRFERLTVEAIDETIDEGFEPTTRDGAHDHGAPADGGPRRAPAIAARTRVHVDASRSVVTRNESPDIPFDRSINPYRGCEHGCIYCFARPNHAYLGWSPGLDFETEILAKPRAPDLLREHLARPSYRPAVIAMGTATDPYQPVERRLAITRSILEVLREHRHPVSIVTKSDLVVRDLDLLAAMAEERLAQVMLSITTLDGALAQRMEPRASAPHRRIGAIRRLAEAGVPVGVLASPMIPGLNDHELERILGEAAAAGATRAGTILVRLPHEVKDLFVEWLDAHYPHKKGKVLSLIRSCRSGALNAGAFGERMRGSGPYAELLSQRFAAAARRHGLATEREPLDTSRFVRPERAAGTRRQLRLF